MDLVDLIIIVLAVVAIIRGRELGSVRQLCSTLGFIGGFFLGAWIGPKFIHLAHTAVTRSLITLVITLGLALIFLSLGEYLGEVLKSKFVHHKIDAVDKVVGAAVGGLALLVTVWLGAAILVKLPYPALQNQIRGSAIASGLTRVLPQAPSIVADLSHAISPNGFPNVFSGNEPVPNSASLPSLGSLQAAVTKDEASVVKLEGRGCGGIVEGSGFVVSPGVVVTNAHVVAGIAHPTVIDQSGRHNATAIWFDPDLDLAVLSVNGLNDPVLRITTQTADSGTPAAVLGYPGGGNFDAQPATVLEEFTAVGQNIYNQGRTTRAVYEVKATVIPGNSGGPLVNASGTVIGVVFAQSTTYNQIGYALTTSKVVSEIHQAEAQNTPVSTGQCAE